MTRALAAYEVCGCCAAVTVLDGLEADAYKDAADFARRGFRVEQVDVDEWKARGLWCADHPDGPPWWKVHGGNGKRPADYQPQQEMGL